MSTPPPAPPPAEQQQHQPPPPLPYRPAQPQQQPSFPPPPSSLSTNQPTAGPPPPPPPTPAVATAGAGLPAPAPPPALPPRVPLHPQPSQGAQESQNQQLPPAPPSLSTPLSHQAGGGATMTMRNRPLESFNPAVLAHLKNIYTTHLAQQEDSRSHPTSNSQDALFSSIQGGGDGPVPAGTIQTLSSFLTYMASPSSSAMAVPVTSRDEESRRDILSHPITSYYISTSHNTYLSGNQLYGEASAAAYRNVLLRGCRCLEIDVWNGEEGGGKGGGEDGLIGEEDGGLEDHAGQEGGGRKREQVTERLGRLAAKVKGRVSSRSRSKSNSRLHIHNPLHHHQTDSTVRPPHDFSSSLTNPETDAMPAPWSPPSGGGGGSNAGAGNVVEPRVLHGHTLTKDVSFRSVCETIGQNAFVASSLPIIVSLEVHANLQQQEIMVEIMRQTWKGLLVDLDEAQEAINNNLAHLPSPYDLRNKILIKVKWSADPNSTTGESTDPRDHVAAAHVSDRKEQEEEEEQDENTFAPPPTASVGEPAQKAQKASKILHELSKLGIYTRGYSFKTFSAPEASLVNHVFSLSEAKVQDFCKDGGVHATALFRHNRNFLMRVFPSGLRVNSSNVEPTFLWRRGAQLVALNWQKWDRGMMLNEGMFAGQEGWVLKPEGYRGTHPATESRRKGDDEGTMVKRTNMSLTIEVLAGQNIPLPAEKEHASRFHPYVQMQLHADCRPSSSESNDLRKAGPVTSGAYTTGGDKVVAGVGSRSDADDPDDADTYKRRSTSSRTADPDFGGEKLHWANLVGLTEELSFLRVKIKDDRIGTDDLAAWACIRLDRLQPGFRFIRLLDAKAMAVVRV